MPPPAWSTPPTRLGMALGLSILVAASAQAPLSTTGAPSDPGHQLTPANSAAPERTNPCSVR
jgi:hypothetical protein